MGAGRTLQGSRKKLEIDVGVFRDHRRRCARQASETLARQAKDIFRSDISLNIGFGKRDDPLSQSGEAANAIYKIDKKKPVAVTPLQGRIISRQKE